MSGDKKILIQLLKNQHLIMRALSDSGRNYVSKLLDPGIKLSDNLLKEIAGTESDPETTSEIADLQYKKHLETKML